MRSTMTGIGVVLLAAGCADEADKPEDLCLLRAASDCDVQDDECVAHVHAVVACMRETEHPLPEIERFTVAEYVDQLPAPELPTPEEAQVNAQFVAGFKLLRLLPDEWEAPDPSAVTITAPLITYDWERQVLTIVVDGQDLERELSGLVYTLALADRDAEVGLQGLFLEQTATFDQKRALIALFAGESTFYTDLALARDVDYAATAARGTYAYATEYTHERFADPQTTWGEAMADFQYYFGAAATLQRFVDGGPAAVTAGYSEAIGSTAYALATPGDEIEAAFSAIDTALPDPPAGFRYLSQDTFGPVMWHIATIRAEERGSDPAAVEALARGWVGDRAVFAGEVDGDGVAVVWQTATQDGGVSDMMIVASDEATRTLFVELFG